MDSFADLAAKVSPAVVNIRTVKTVKEGPMPNFFQYHRPGPQGPGNNMEPEEPNGPRSRDQRDLYEFFRRFFGGPGGPGGEGEGMPHEFKQRSLGSGVVVDQAGYVLTNNHVVAEADEITVRFKSGDEYPATIVGRDKKTDMALLKLKGDHSFPALPLGDSDKIRVGDWVLAVGNPFGLEHTVTAGIISAKGRIIGAGPYDDFLQTDASINPGNSGGPLINMDGEVVGINTAIVAQGQGIGFAIPVNIVRSVMEQLKTKGRVVRGWLGVMIQPVTSDLAKKFGLEGTAGALVADVVANGPAAQAGMKRGDVVVKFDGKKVADWHYLPRLVALTPVGKSVEVEVIRGGEKTTLDVKLGELKEGETAVASGGGQAEQPSLETKLGLSVQDLTPELAKQLGLKDTKGLVVTKVAPDGPAAEAGLRRGDVILEAAQKPVGNAEEFQTLAKKLAKGDGLLLLVQRGENTLFVVVKGSE
ncbi:MAG: DegQ family serine endoprotease [Deltaproteobacteria bacterium]|nr:DegQ family serine endoprotease [Deltaproteobacteria bacterium]